MEPTASPEDGRQSRDFARFWPPTGPTPGRDRPATGSTPGRDSPATAPTPGRDSPATGPAPGRDSPATGPAPGRDALATGAGEPGSSTDEHETGSNKPRLGSREPETGGSVPRPRSAGPRPSGISNGPRWNDQGGFHPVETNGHRNGQTGPRHGGRSQANGTPLNGQSPAINGALPMSRSPFAPPPETPPLYAPSPFAAAGNPLLPDPPADPDGDLSARRPVSGPPATGSAQVPPSPSHPSGAPGTAAGEGRYATSDAGLDTHGSGHGLHNPGFGTHGAGLGPRDAQPDARDAGAETRDAGIGPRDAGAETRDAGSGARDPRLDAREVGSGTHDAWALPSHGDTTASGPLGAADRIPDLDPFPGAFTPSGSDPLAAPSAAEQPDQWIRPATGAATTSQEAAPQTTGRRAAQQDVTADGRAATGDDAAGTRTGSRRAAGKGPAGRRVADDGGPLRPGDLDHNPISFWDEAAGKRFQAEWHEVKAQFVDDPVAALTRAHDLLTEAAHELTESMLRQRDELDPLRGTSIPDTESMRMAMRGYREFLDRILAL
ncbi:hypothetical protein EDD30_1948 [Couchioplanes caeruleus]|uniref:Uncharacterized protein n=2 Tax=Couchioplanes caeruleus TaxID=56438 RepID=A0A3N1GFV9_9ACTN|nr:hypothetical protein EDD30_1948 [Couchioplanes caeruleus]